MECCCGCGIRVRGRRPQELNLEAVEVALELLVWDKARSRQTLEPADRDRFDALIDRGAQCYRSLLASLHGEREPMLTDEAEIWLAESRREREDRKSMTETGFFSHGLPKLDDEDLERLDRRRPERTFSGRNENLSMAEEDLATALERLGGLHTEGILSDEEFAAAKARMIERYG